MAEIEDVTRTWTSSLSTTDLAEAFRESVTAASKMSLLDRYGAFVGRSINERSVTGAKSFGDLRNALEFFTPDSSGPFAEFEVQADFSVGASIPHKDGNPVAAHMDVYEDDDQRRVTLRILYIASLGHTRARRKLAEKTMRKLQDGIAVRDPASR